MTKVLAERVLKYQKISWYSCHAGKPTLTCTSLPSSQPQIQGHLSSVEHASGAVHPSSALTVMPQAFHGHVSQGS